MSRRKGAAAENEVVKHLRTAGFPYAERRLTGSDDPYGDVAGIPGVVIEVKNHATLDLAGWVNQLLEELAAADADTGAVIHKRKGHTDVANWYATLPASLYFRLLCDAGYGQNATGPLAEFKAEEWVGTTDEYHTSLQALRAERAELDGAA
jgi:hypothetical protein